MAYSFPQPRHDDSPSPWTGLAEPPPPLVRVARNRGLTPIQAYLRLLEEDRIDLNNEVNQYLLSKRR
jgi:hypothetical protein